MSSFTEPLTVTKLSARLWKIEKEFDYHVGSKESTEVITIPKGFVTDFASVPRFAWILIPPDGMYTQAAVVHDYLYFTKKYTRLKSDKIFLEAMKVLGVGWWKRSTMYNCVRAWAWIPWKKGRSHASTLSIIFLILMLGLTGCASTNIFRNPITGKIEDVESKGIQNTGIKEEIIEEGVVIVTDENGVTTKTVAKLTYKSEVTREAAWSLWPSSPVVTVYKD